MKTWATPALCPLPPLPFPPLITIPCTPRIYYIMITLLYNKKTGGEGK